MHTENISAAYNPAREAAFLIPTAIFGISLFLLYLYGTFQLLRPRRELSNKRELLVKGLFFSLWLWVPVISLFIFSVLFRPVLGPIRYILYVSPAYYLLISKGVMDIKKKARSIMIILLVLASLLFIYEYYRAEKRPDWRGVCGIIKNSIRADENSAFLINDSRPISFSEHIMLLYYKVPSVIGIKSLALSGRMPEEERKVYDKEVERVGGVSAGDLTSKGIWLVTQFFGEPEVLKRLGDRYSLVGKWEFQDVILYHFRVANHR